MYIHICTHIEYYVHLHTGTSHACGVVGCIYEYVYIYIYMYVYAYLYIFIHILSNNTPVYKCIYLYIHIYTHI